jgi:hypothetical protein
VLSFKQVNRTEARCADARVMGGKLSIVFASFQTERGPDRKRLADPLTASNYQPRADTLVQPKRTEIRFTWRSPGGVLAFRMKHSVLWVSCMATGAGVGRKLHYLNKKCAYLKPVWCSLFP